MKRNKLSAGVKSVCEKYFAKNSWLDRHWKIVAIFAIIAAVGLYVWLCWANIGKWSIWFDESFGAYLIRFNVADIAKYTAHDVHPPLYYLLLKLWAAIFGNSDVALRSLSVVFGAGVIIAGFGLTKKMFGRAAAFIVLLLLALSPMLVRYGFEARMYTMVAFVAIVATWLLVLARQRNSRKLWVAYGVVIALGMWTHYFTALIWVAHLVWQYVDLRMNNLRGKNLRKVFFSKNMLWGYGVGIVVFLPWLPYMIWQLRTVTGSGFWIPNVGVDTATDYASNALVYSPHDAVSPWAALLIFAVVGLGLWLAIRTYKSMQRSEKRKLWLIIFSAFLPPILLFLASLPPMRSSFVDRYLLPSVVIGVVFAAVVIRFRRKDSIGNVFRTILFVATLAASIVGIVNVMHYGNYNFFTRSVSRAQETANAIAAQSENAPIIADSTWTFYDSIQYDTPENPVYFLDASTNYHYGSLMMLRDNDFRKVKNIDDIAKPGDKVWYVSGDGAADRPPFDNWKLLRTVQISNSIANDAKPDVMAAEYLVD